MNKEEAINKLKEIRKENQEDIAIVEEYVNTGEEEEIVEAIDIVLNELKYYTDLIKSAKQYVEENSHEFMCERDGGLPELEFYDNTNASDLLGILDGNF